MLEIKIICGQQLWTDFKPQLFGVLFEQCYFKKGEGDEDIMQVYLSVYFFCLHYHKKMIFFI